MITMMFQEDDNNEEKDDDGNNGSEDDEAYCLLSFGINWPRRSGSNKVSGLMKNVEDENNGVNNMSKGSREVDLLWIERITASPTSAAYLGH